MPRSYKSTEVYLKPDPRFGSKLAAKIINKIMWDGAKTKAKGNGDAGAVATVGAGAVELGLDGPTFEDLVRDVLAEELRRWVEDNLEAVTERVVREEIQMMGRRRRPPES